MGDQVRRLGVDHSFKRPKKAFTVQRNRTKLVKQRNLLVNNLRIIASTPKTFVAGIQPAALFGADLVQPSPQTIKEVNKAAYQAGPLRPSGVAAEVARLWYPTQQLPDFRANYAPIGRYAREAWLAAQLPGSTHSSSTSSKQ